MINDIKILAGQITLADAVYVDFSEAINSDGSFNQGKVKDALIAERGYTETQAADFIARWHVVSQKPDTDSGFSATLFESTDPAAVQPYAFAIKGTKELLVDLVATDFSDIAVDGLALDQIVDLSNYWNQLKTPKGQTFTGAELVTLENETINLMLAKTGVSVLVDGDLITAAAYIESLYARDDIIIDNNFFFGSERVRTIQYVLPAPEDPDFSGLLDIPVTVNNVAGVTGHSLGGHVAVAMTRLVSGLEAVTINGAGFATGRVPGIGGDAELNIRNLFSMLGGNSSFDASQILNLHGDKMPDLITQNTSLGLVQQGGHEELFIEPPSLIDDLAGHAAGPMVDSLSVFILLARVDSSVANSDTSVTLAKFNSIFESASNVASDSLESVINTIGELFQVDGKAVIDDRESLYARLSEINKEIFVDPYLISPQLKPQYQNLQIVDVDSLSYAAELDTADGYAYRYALTTLNTFAITGDASLYTQHNQNGELNAENFSAQKLNDRAAFLNLIIQRNIDDQHGSYSLTLDEAPDIDDAEITKSPVLLDLDGDGIDTTSLSIFFDHDADGFQEKTAWVGADDGLLVMDINDDGEINSGLELFGSNTKLASGETAENGYQALDDLYSNEDGILSAADEAWQNLQVWQDANGNASVDDGELKTLDEWNIQSLNLSAQSSTLIDENKNEHRLTSTMTMTDGTERETADVWFQVDRAQRIQQAVELSDDIEELPDARGFGTVADLRNAMAENENLQALVELYVAETDPEVRHAMIEPLIFEWAGVTDVDPDSRDPSRIYGHVMDARQLETLEALVGRGYEGTWCWGERDPNPHAQAAPKLIAEFEKFAVFFEAQLLAQTEYKNAFNWVYSDFNSEGKNIFANFEQFESKISSLYSKEAFSNITEIVSVAEGLGTYSSCFRERTEESFYQLIIQSPEIAFLLISDFIKGTSAAETLQGSALGEMLDGKAGDDILYGYAGDDMYHFAQGHGSDRILDSSGTDTIYLGEGFTPENIRLSRDAISVWIERLDDNGEATGDSIQIDNFYNFDGMLDSPIESILFDSDICWDLEQIQAKFPVDIDAQDNAIYASQVADQINALDGDDVVWGYGGEDRLDGGTGSDEIHGGDGNDTLIGGSGDDSLIGGNGADVYQFSVGHGKDTIHHYDRDSNSADSIYFDETIMPADIIMLREDGDLLINGQEGDQICIKSFFNESGTTPYAIDNITFSDGTIWDKAFILDAVKVITDGDDLIIGYGGQDEEIAGLAGDDIIYGYTGNDTLQGNQGADKLYGGDGDDLLEGGEGDDTLTVRMGTNTLDGGAGDDKLTVDRWSYGSQYFQKNTLIGGEGNDRLEGFNSAETYIFNRGDGQDVINDHMQYNYGGAQDKIVFGAEILREQVSVARNGEHIVLTISDPEGVATDSITIENAFSNSEYRIEQVVFADGTTLSAAEVQALAKVIQGTSAAETLTGTLGNDVLQGNQGNDYLIGGQGNDCYEFSIGDGQDTINNFSNIADETDLLVLGEGIAKDDIWLTRSGEDLVIDLSGSDDQITVDSWFVDEAHQVDEIHVDNALLLSSKVDGLISAMAGFDNPAAGNMDISSQIKDEIAPTIVAAWQAA